MSFNPRPPRGGRPVIGGPSTGALWFQSAPPARGATAAMIFAEVVARVSIRAPRAGGDSRRRARGAPDRCFNPRPPRGGRHGVGSGRASAMMFQSAPPARGATAGGDGHDAQRDVSIRAPRAGGDSCRPRCLRGSRCFNPRPPRGGRPEKTLEMLERVTVSIRAPRAGGDVWNEGKPRMLGCFNPRPPRGGRPRTIEDDDPAEAFQSAPPARGATRLRAVACRRSRGFNPRPPRGGRRGRGGEAACPLGFNPRPPRGGRPVRDLCLDHLPEFQSAPPARGATPQEACLSREAAVSIRAPRAGGDGSSSEPSLSHRGFQSAPPARGATVSDYFIVKERQNAGGTRTSLFFRVIQRGMIVPYVNSTENQKVERCANLPGIVCVLEVRATLPVSAWKPWSAFGSH